MILFDLAKVFSFGGRRSVAELPPQTRRAMYAPELTSFCFCGNPKNVASCFSCHGQAAFPPASVSRR